MKVMTKMRGLLLLVLFLVSISCFQGSTYGAGIPLQSRLSNAVVLYFDNPVAYSKNVKTYIDTSNLELAPIVRNDRTLVISVILILSDYDKLFPGRITTNESSYRTQVLNYFSKYKNHPAITFFKSANKRVGGGLPANILVHLSAPPQLSQQVPFSDNIKDRIKDEKFLNEYIANMRSFAEDTNFMDFYLANLDKYQSFIE